MELIKSYVTNNMHYTNNRQIKIRTLVIHSVGCPQPSPEVFLKNWNTTTNKYLAQIVIGTEKAYEVLPCTATKGYATFCWHVGTANAYSIGAEMTEPSTIKYTSGANFTDLNPEKTKAHVLATYKNAVDIFAQLCTFHGLDPTVDGTVLSHNECCARGIGTNHADVEHLWNYCGLTMDQFRKDIKAAMGNTNITIKDNTDCLIKGTIKVGSLVKINSDAKYYNGKYIPAWVKNLNWYVSGISGDRLVLGKSEDGKYNIQSPVKTTDVTLASGILSTSTFKVQVTATNLNIRTGPATTYPRISYIAPGVYTIVETSNNWGRLKSKQSYNGKSVDGWISLNYAKKI